MQSLRNSVLSYVRVRASTKECFTAEHVNPLCWLTRRLCTPNSTGPDHVMARVIELVKKFDKIDATKVSETADFQKDLSLDSLDRVELVMAVEEEFSIEIPEEKADKLKCCADVAEYIISASGSKNAENS